MEMYDSVHEVAPEPAQEIESTKVNLGGQVGRVNLSLKMPQPKAYTATFASPMDSNPPELQSNESFKKPKDGSREKLKLYPRGDSTRDQVQVAINVANKISKQTMSIQKEVASF